MPHKYGAEYAVKTCKEVWEKRAELLKRNFYYRNPRYMDIIPDNYLFSILNSQNSIMQYEVTAMQIYRAEQLLGEEGFRRVLAKLYRRYRNGISYEDFLKECGLEKEAIS